MTTLYVDNIAPNLQSKISAPNLQLPSGSVVQVVHENNPGGIFSSNSQLWVSTGLTATITPTSTNSRIIVTVAARVSRPAVSGEAPRLKVTRGGVELIGSSNIFYSTDSFDYSGAHATFVLEDSPNTTSATTYTLEFRTRSGNTCEANAGSTQVPDTLSLMEIAG